MGSNEDILEDMGKRVGVEGYGMEWEEVKDEKILLEE